MNKLKVITVTLLVILLTAVIITLLMGGFMPLFSLAFGILFIYYIIIYFLIIQIPKRKTKWYKYLVYVLFTLPILFGIIDWESLFEFLLQGVLLDMR